MGTNLVYFGHEKPLSNIVRYGSLKRLIEPESVILVEEKFSSKYIDSMNIDNLNLVSITSTWSDKDKNLFYDHQLIINFLNKNNKSLNIYLKNRVFGPFKIKSKRTLIDSLKYLFNFIININFRIILICRRRSTESLLDLLRLNKYLKGDDRKTFDKILDRHKISRVIIFTTLSDPSVFDLVEVCAAKKIQCILLPDCWDNISTAYSIPKNVSHIYVWSAQQMRDIQKYFPDLELRSEIIGTYRLDIQKSKRIYNEKIKATPKDGIRILYLGGYHLVETTNALSYIMKIVCNLEINLKFNVEVIIRGYPFKKQTGGKLEQPIDLTLENYNNLSSIKYLISTKNDLAEDLMYADLVVSELSTAGLESAFFGLPVIFINSNRSLKWLSTKKAFEFSYSKDLFNFFQIVNITSDNGEKILGESLRTIILSRKDLANVDFLIEEVFQKLKFLGEPFDFNRWHQITS